MRAHILIADGDVVPVTYSLLWQPAEIAPCKWGLFVFSVHRARTSYQHHKWKENEQVEPLSLQQGPNYTTHSVYCQNRAFCCWALWVKHRENVGCSKPCPFKSKLLVSVKFDQNKHSFRKKVNGVTFTSKDLMRLSAGMCKWTLSPYFKFYVPS